MKVYVSGQMTDSKTKKLLPDFVEKFVKAGISIAQLGYEPVLPISNGLAMDSTREQNLAADLKMLLGCDIIAMLPCWENSEGARLEYEFAKVMDKEILYYTISEKFGVQLTPF